ncbi:MAG: ribonuclease E inhibitor RraB [Blastocatellales bacterium]
MSNTIWVILLLLGLSLALIFFRRRKSPSGSAESTGKPPDHDKPVTSTDDRTVLDQLKQAGSNLSKPHDLEFYLYFPAEESAQQAAEKLEADGFEGELRPSAANASWLCLVRKRMVPELNEIVAIRKKLTSLAREFKGEYDGWETKVEQ